MFNKRLSQERSTVTRFMPKNTVAKNTAEGVSGWLYSIKTELGNTFQFFAYFDGSYYQVLVVKPVLEDKWRSPHTGHLYGDGKICFGNNYDSGMPSLKEAFSKSALWANGISVALVTGQFPFSKNNR